MAPNACMQYAMHVRCPDPAFSVHDSIRKTVLQIMRSVNQSIHEEKATLKKME